MRFIGNIKCFFSGFFCLVCFNKSYNVYFRFEEFESLILVIVVKGSFNCKVIKLEKNCFGN